MAQFDVYQLRSGVLVVDLQSDLVGITATRLVAPLREAGRHVAVDGLNPHVELAGQRWIVRVQEMAALPGGEMGLPVGTVREAGAALKRAVEILVDGV